jgi:hypothetical protein
MLDAPWPGEPGRELIQTHRAGTGTGAQPSLGSAQRGSAQPGSTQPGSTQPGSTRFQLDPADRSDRSDRRSPTGAAA